MSTLESFTHTFTTSRSDTGIMNGVYGVNQTEPATM